MTASPEPVPGPDTQLSPTLIDVGAFVRALFYPLAIWGIMVGLSVIGGAPGVVCVTPLAWLLAAISGLRYATFTGRRPARYAFLGPGLAGLLLGMGEGALFILVISSGLPPYAPSEAFGAAVMTIIMLGGGMLVCTALSVMTAWLRWKRSERG
jgi:hypothetical protein